MAISAMIKIVIYFKNDFNNFKVIQNPQTNKF